MEEGLTMASTHARLCAVSVRMVSVRPWWNRRVSAVSYVAVKHPWSRYHASWSAICTKASGARRAVHDDEHNA